MTDHYQDIGNVNEIHMKSILLTKLFAIENQGIKYRFECRTPIQPLTINPFDMVRLLSITLDNAIEAVQDNQHKYITIVIYQAPTSLNIMIENTDQTSASDVNTLRQLGTTTKQKHSGLGLSIIDDIRHKYHNVLVSYKWIPAKFSVQITIET
ncbi:hypothetical protein C5Z25_03925 [Lactobacillus sp. CBA3605]|uniref:GHKL domain-containing protein n=1 Tax=Lactobacillus sp. CBA3605 TaxID=2099788 RepID=UPI000CFD97F5|nr:GHKL domain-containing protein [Lactobacillus sp. CBA3605]AVK60956.1 hypothetical protein C5Z25_03925 [Lactobacillus sp. CBA3605]